MAVRKKTVTEGEPKETEISKEPEELQTAVARLEEAVAKLEKIVESASSGSIGKETKQKTPFLTTERTGRITLKELLGFACGFLSVSWVLWALLGHLTGRN